MFLGQSRYLSWGICALSLFIAVPSAIAKPIKFERKQLVPVNKGRLKQAKGWDTRAKSGKPGTDPSGLLKSQGRRGARGAAKGFKVITPFPTTKLKKAKKTGARGAKKRKKVTLSRLEAFINKRLKKRKGARGAKAKPFKFGAKKIKLGKKSGRRGARGKAPKKSFTPEEYVAELEKLDKKARKLGLSVLDDDGIKPDFTKPVACGGWAEGRSDLKGKACVEEVIEVSSLEENPKPDLIGQQAKSEQVKRRLRAPTTLNVQQHHAFGAKRKKGSRGAVSKSGFAAVLKKLKKHRNKKGARGARGFGPRRFSKAITVKTGAPKRSAPLKTKKGSRGVLLPANAAEHIALLREELGRNYSCGKTDKSLDSCLKKELKSKFKCAGSEKAVESCVGKLTKGTKTLVKAYYEKEKQAIKAHFNGMKKDLRSQLNSRIAQQKARLAKTKKQIDTALKSLKGAQHCAKNASKCFDKQSAKALKKYLGVDCQKAGGTDCVKNLAGMTASKLKSRLTKEVESVRSKLKTAQAYAKDPSKMWKMVQDEGFQALEGYLPAGQRGYFKQALGCVKNVDACIADLKKKGVDQLSQLTNVIKNKSYKTSRKGQHKFGGASTAQVIIRYQYDAEASLEQVKLDFAGSAAGRILKSKELQILGVKGHFIGQPKTGKVTAKVTATVMGIDKVVAPFKEAYQREKKKFDKAYQAELKNHKSKKGSRGATTGSVLSFEDTKSLASSEWSTGYGFSLGWVTFKVEAGLAYDTGIEYGVHLKPVALAASVAPYVMSDAFARFAADFYVVEAGIEGRLTLLDATITFMGEIGLAGDDTGFYVYNYFAGDLDLETLSGKISAYLKLNLLIVTKKWTHKIFGWKGIRKSWRLFRFDMPRVMIKSFLDEDVPEGLDVVMGEIKANVAPDKKKVMRMQGGDVVGKAMKGPKKGTWARPAKCKKPDCVCDGQMAVSGFRLWMQPKQGGKSPSDQRGTWRCPKGSDVYSANGFRRAKQKPGCFVYKASPFRGKPPMPTNKQVRPVNADDAAVTGIQFECTSLDGKKKKVITPNPEGNTFDQYQLGFATVAEKRHQAWPKPRESRGKRSFCKKIGGDCGWRRCKAGHFLVGYNVNVESSVGGDEDDTAVNDIDMLCSDGTWLRGASGFDFGKWRPTKGKRWRQRCKVGQFIRGIVPHYEPVRAWVKSKKKPWGEFWADDTGLNGITIHCAQDEGGLVDTLGSQLELLVDEKILDPLTLYWNDKTKDNLTWVGKLSKAQRKAGYQRIRTQGYLYRVKSKAIGKSNKHKFRKLITYYHKKRKDYYTAVEGSAQAKEAIRLGYKKKKVLGWVWALRNHGETKKPWAKVGGKGRIAIDGGVVELGLVAIADYWSPKRKDHIAVGTAAGVQSTKAKRHGYIGSGNMGFIFRASRK